MCRNNCYNCGTMSSVDNLKTLLASFGYSVTKPRLRVFEALLGHESLSMHDLLHRLDTIDRASAYRTVELFERLGIVQRINTGWKYKLELSDKFAKHHHHLTCTQCGRTIAMNENELEQLITRMAQAHHFKPSAHQIEIQGLCQNCQTS